MESNQGNKEEHHAMRLSYSFIAKRPALLQRLTGLTVVEFEHLWSSLPRSMISR